jgi:hypothetical protein
MIAELEKYPRASMAWCNQKIWEELPDDSWRDTGQYVNPLESDNPSRLVRFGNKSQIMGALHANGAMIMRTHSRANYQTPPTWPFLMTEAFRERMIPHPLLYVTKPLAVFSKTLKTSRPASHSTLAVMQTIFSATFLKYAPYTENELKAVFETARARKISFAPALLLAAVMEPGCRGILRFSQLRDWLLLLRRSGRRPQVLWQVLRSRSKHADWWRLIDLYTAERFTEERQIEVKSGKCPTALNGLP